MLVFGFYCSSLCMLIVTMHPTVPSVCLCRLNEPPESLDNLSDSLGLLEELQGKVPELEQQFEPLTAQFNVLEKYDVTVSEEVGCLGGGGGLGLLSSCAQCI